MFPVAIVMHLKPLNLVLVVRVFDSEHIFLTFLCLFYFILFLFWSFLNFIPYSMVVLKVANIVACGYRRLHAWYIYNWSISYEKSPKSGQENQTMYNWSGTMK